MEHGFSLDRYTTIVISEGDENCFFTAIVSLAAIAQVMILHILLLLFAHFSQRGSRPKSNNPRLLCPSCHSPLREPVVAAFHQLARRLLPFSRWLISFSLFSGRFAHSLTSPTSHGKGDFQRRGCTTPAVGGAGSMRRLWREKVAFGRDCQQTPVSEQNSWHFKIRQQAGVTPRFPMQYWLTEGLLPCSTTAQYNTVQVCYSTRSTLQMKAT